VSKDERVLELDGIEVTVTNPGKVFFPRLGKTKLDLINYYVSVGEGALRGARDRPMNLKRFPNGAEGDPFFQKRAPTPRPDWVETATVRFPSDRTADEVVCANLATIAWIVNLGCIDLNPWAVRTPDLEHPDELRIDLDPQPDASWSDVCQVALVARSVLEEHGLIGFPKTSGSRGMHVYVRIEPEQGFEEVRRAALALAREVERRMPHRATSRWWKEEREGVFIDYNQNARDRTVASAYSVRAVPDARVSCPLEWNEVPEVEPADLTLQTVPARLRDHGDASAGIDQHHHRLDSLLELAARDEREGLGDAPWPPHFRKQKGEPPRVQPSRARAGGKGQARADGKGQARADGKGQARAGGEGQARAGGEGQR
jgi:bifunctional non-homologous end joining protein LigD